MTELRGSWRPARVALRRILAAQLAAKAGDPAFSDADGTLSRAELWRLVRLRSAAPAGPVVVVSSPQPRTVVVDALAGWLAGRTVLVVPPRAGERVLRAARETAPCGAGVFFATSGTTGAARVVRSRRGPRALAQLAAPIGILPLSRRPVVAGLAPVDHGHGFTAALATWALGGHFIALGPDPLRQLADLPRVDLLTGVPEQLHRLAAAADRPPTRIGAVLSGSDRLRDADRLAVALAAPVYDAYGTTETGTVSLATPADRASSPGTVGRPLPGVRIRERDGRLEVRSAVLGRGSFTADHGFLRDGLVHVSGRVDGVRVSGGENTFPPAVRDWLAARPGVTEVVLEERPDTRFGSRTVARVVTTEPLDATALREAVRAEFGHAATPAAIIIDPVDAF